MGRELELGLRDVVVVVVEGERNERMLFLRKGI
jgi:hypothetical protein